MRTGAKSVPGVPVNNRKLTKRGIRRVSIAITRRDCSRRSGLFRRSGHPGGDPNGGAVQRPDWPFGVDPVSWTPEHLRSRSPACRRRDDITRQSFVAR